MNYGYVKSDLNPSDIRINLGSYPNSYEIRYPGAVVDQGLTPKCVSVCMTDMINYKLKFRGKKIVRDSYFFDNRRDKSTQGMTPKEAFKILSQGVHISGVDYKCNAYSRLGSIEQMKYSIVSLGPIMACLPCYSNLTNFWENDGTLEGGHAVTLIGYDSNGFKLKNSWGVSYGEYGYSLLPYNAVSIIYECWCLIN